VKRSNKTLTAGDGCRSRTSYGIATSVEQEQARNLATELASRFIANKVFKVFTRHLVPKN
jgi:hypothetical protein